ncbi:hypothetical protein D4764_11G0002380 [Takifugu flavidus]|uniref:Uncharacterized protein n=1 Tax=Takifugu flavidus TaxID=433684 RepID=A0A5C6PIB4_9TELE|nr:hypothetical protein D4764_11G0002380 [Takifugu flavidus]
MRRASDHGELELGSKDTNNNRAPAARRGGLKNRTTTQKFLIHLRPLVSSFMDPLQLAYQLNIGVDDAII